MRYQIETNSSGDLLVSLRVEGQNRVLYRDTILPFVRPIDGPPLLYLARWMRGDVFEKIVIPKREISVALACLVETNALFFRGKLLAKSARPIEKRGEGRFFVGDERVEEIAFFFPGGCIAKNAIFSLEVKEEVMPPPLPILELVDDTGAFVNLLFLYETVGEVYAEDLQREVGGKKRHFEQEAFWEKDLFEAGFSRKAVEGASYSIEVEKSGVALELLFECGWKLRDRNKVEIVWEREKKVLCQEGDAGVFLEGEVVFSNGETLSLPSLWRKKGLFVTLPSGKKGVVNFDPNWKLGVVVGGKIALPRTSLFSLEERYLPSSLSSSLRSLEKKKTLPHILVPDTFLGKLLSYQQEGVNWLYHLWSLRFSALLADEMGLGKTVQVLAFFACIATGRFLLVVPSSLLAQWEREWKRFLPSLPISRYSREEPLALRGAILLSYDMLRKDLPFLEKERFDVVVLDEAHRIKNPSTDTAKAAFSLRADFRISLTGTPIENRSEELWSQFHFLLPTLLGPKSQWSKEMGVARKIAPFLQRRTKEEVQLQLPEKIYQDVWVDLTQEQSLLYDKYFSSLDSRIIEKMGKEETIEVLEAILRLRQIALDPRLVGEDISGSKMELLLEEVEGKSSLVFSQFTTFLHLVREELVARGKAVYLLEGSTPLRERDALVEKFQQGEGEAVFLISLKAGGVGLNLTRAEYVFLLDPWWNASAEEQAIARAHRIGQTKTLIVRRYLAARTIEENLRRLQEEKMDLIQRLSH